MKTFQATLAVLAACLLIPAFSFAGHEGEAERHLVIKVAADDEMVEIDATDFEVGETRQSFTESGKEVLITRTEDGFQLEIEGKDIDVDIPHVDIPHGEDHHAMINLTGDGDRKVVVRKFHGEGDGHGYHYVHAAGDEDVEVVIQRFSAADRLEESGVLDDLDEAKRREILDTLREMEPHRIHKEVRVKVKEEQGADR